MMHVVDIADIKAASAPGDVLVTYSLGSCLGVVAYDPVAKVAGMLHCMLPRAQINPQKAEAQPAMFADTGLMALLFQLFAMGAQKRNLVIKVAGGASVLDANDQFRIGERNIEVLHKFLEKNSLSLKSSQLGGCASRTVYHYLADGRTVVKSGGKETEL